MANDERQSETFIREVDEELRRDQLKALWKRFAPLIIGVCVLIVAITAGYRGYMWWEERRAAQAGDRFMAALSEIESGKREEGEKALAAIAVDGGGGYPALARLRLAGEKAGAGAKADAISAYDAVAADKSVPAPLRDLALVRAALLALDTGDVAGVKSRVEPLDQSGNAWRHAAREVIGMADYQSGDLKAAREAFEAIQQDAETPQDIWLRSSLMISLIDGQLAAPDEGAAAPEPAGGEEAADESDASGEAQETAPEPEATPAPTPAAERPAPAAPPVAPVGAPPPATTPSPDATPPADTSSPADAAPAAPAPAPGDTPTNPAQPSP